MVVIWLFKQNKITLACTCRWRALPKMKINFCIYIRFLHRLINQKQVHKLQYFKITSYLNPTPAENTLVHVNLTETSTSKRF